MRKFLPFVCIFFFPPFLGFSQPSDFDTLRVFSYNLTNYGNNISPCTATNNGLTLKNPAFKTIVQYVKPDILGVCEMNTNPIIAGNFLTNVLNTDGVNYFVRSGTVTEPSGTITSVLFYDSRKMTLAYQSKASTQYRLTHHFRLYLRNDGLALGDTIWLNVLLCHLKAGTASSDVADRSSMALTIRNYLASFPKRENCLIMGDFNFYRSSEAGFQTLTSVNPQPAYQFFDPINRVGTWTANASFADVHTQCPRTDNNGGCYSGGGMDDRFDFILMNRHLLNDSAGIRYIPGSYKAIGNDGLHYNTSINSPPANNSVPPDVLAALFLASDHLPVRADLRVRGNFVTASNLALVKRELKLQLIDGLLLVEGVLPGENMQTEVLDLFGRFLWIDNQPMNKSGQIVLPASLLSGHRVIRVKTASGKSGLLRLMQF